MGKEKILEFLNENVDVIKDMVNEINGWNGYLDEYQWDYNDDEFYESFFKNKVDVARAVYYGGSNYNFNEEYVRFDAYGNLETIDEFTYNNTLQENALEILDIFIEYYNNEQVYIYNDEFKTMLDEYLEGEENGTENI